MQCCFGAFFCRLHFNLFKKSFNTHSICCSDAPFVKQIKLKERKYPQFKIITFYLLCKLSNNNTKMLKNIVKSINKFKELFE